MNDLRIKIQADGAQQTAQAINNVSASMQKVSNASKSAIQPINDLSRIVQDLPYGFTAISNNLNPALESFQRLKRESGSTSEALKALVKGIGGAGGLGLALGAFSAVLTIAQNGLGSWTKGLFGAGKAASEASKQQENYKNVIESTISNLSEEVAKVGVLIQVIKNETSTREQRVAAIKQLQNIAPAYFKTLSTEEINVNAVTQAYNKYLSTIQRTIEAKAIETQLIDIVKKRLELEREVNQPALKRIVIGGQEVDAINAVYDANGDLKKQQEEILKLKKDEAALTRQLARLQPPSAPTTINGGNINIKPDKVTIEKARETFSQITTVNLPSLEIKAVELKLSRNQALDDFYKRNNAQMDKMREKLKEQLATASIVGNGIADAFGNAFDAVVKGENIFKALGESLKQFVLDLIKATIQTIIFRAVVSAIVPGGGSLVPGGGGSLSFGANGLFGKSVPALSSGSSFGGGGRMVIRGRELRLLGARTANSQIRLGGR